MRYQAWRSPSHVSQPYPFTSPGALARFIPPRRQSVREREALTVWRQLCMTKVFGQHLHYRWIFPLPLVTGGHARASTCAEFTLVQDVHHAMGQTFRHGVLTMHLIRSWGAHGWRILYKGRGPCQVDTIHLQTSSSTLWFIHITIQPARLFLWIHFYRRIRLRIG